MPTVYPGALDSFVNPTDTDTLDSPPHDGQHTDVNDAAEAIEGELGINPRGAFATVRARLDAKDIETDMVSSRNDVVTSTTMSTTEQVKITATLVIPVAWNTYEVDVSGKVDWIDNGAAGATGVTVRLRIGGLTGTQIQQVLSEEIDIGSARDFASMAIVGSIGGEVTTGNVDVVLTTQLTGENGLYNSRFLNLFARAYRLT